jgi:hypothetical protein
MEALRSSETIYDLIRRNLQGYSNLKKKLLIQQHQIGAVSICRVPIFSECVIIFSFDVNSFLSVYERA